MTSPYHFYYHHALVIPRLEGTEAPEVRAIPANGQFNFTALDWTTFDGDTIRLGEPVHSTLEGALLFAISPARRIRVYFDVFHRFPEGPQFIALRRAASWIATNTETDHSKHLSLIHI